MVVVWQIIDLFHNSPDFEISIIMSIDEFGAQFACLTIGTNTQDYILHYGQPGAISLS